MGSSTRPARREAAPAEPLLQIHRLNARNGDELSAVMRANDVEVLQTKPATEAWFLDRVAVPGVVVQHGRLGGPALALGAAHASQVEVLLPWSTSAPIHYCGQAMTGRIAVYGPGCSHQARCSAPQGFTLLSFDKQALDLRLQTLDPDDGPNAPEKGFHSLALAPTTELVFRKNILRLVAHARAAANDPEARGPIPLLAEAIVEPVLDMLLRAKTDKARRSPGDRAARRMIMSRVLEYLAGHRHQPVTLEDLCSAGGTGLRNLQYTFQEQFGITPYQFLRWRRLHHARRLLESQAVTSVKAAALDSGFMEFGRFSVEYRRLFGESPSSTLARCDFIQYGGMRRGHGGGTDQKPRSLAADPMEATTAMRQRP